MNNTLRTLLVLFSFTCLAASPSWAGDIVGEYTLDGPPGLELRIERDPAGGFTVVREAPPPTSKRAKKRAPKQPLLLRGTGRLVGDWLNVEFGASSGIAGRISGARDPLAPTGRYRLDEGVLTGELTLPQAGALPVLIPERGITHTPGETLELHVVELKSHGEALLIKTPNGKTIMLDAGRSKKKARKQLRRALATHFQLEPKSSKVDQDDIDLLVLSHDDPDHISGMSRVVDDFEVKEFWYADYRGKVRKSRKKLLKKLRKEGATLRAVTPGYTVSLDGVSLHVLGPPNSTPIEPGKGTTKSNENSVVIMLEFKGTRFLLTGDAETEAEEWLVKRYGTDLACHVLKVGHHGSKNSTTAELLRAAAPASGNSVAVISSYPKYNHPHQSVRARLKTGGRDWYRSDKNGHVIVTTSGGGLVSVSHTRGQASDDTKPKLRLLARLGDLMSDAAERVRLRR
jgi:competence protein ComEC